MAHQRRAPRPGQTARRIPRPRRRRRARSGHRSPTAGTWTSSVGDDQHRLETAQQPVAAPVAARARPARPFEVAAGTVPASIRNGRTARTSRRPTRRNPARIDVVVEPPDLPGAVLHARCCRTSPGRRRRARWLAVADGQNGRRVNHPASMSSLRCPDAASAGAPQRTRPCAPGAFARDFLWKHEKTPPPQLAGVLLERQGMRTRSFVATAVLAALVAAAPLASAQDRQRSASRGDGGAAAPARAVAAAPGRAAAAQQGGERSQGQRSAQPRDGGGGPSAAAGRRERPHRAARGQRPAGGDYAPTRDASRAAAGVRPARQHQPPGRGASRGPRRRPHR